MLAPSRGSCLSPMQEGERGVRLWVLISYLSKLPMPRRWSWVLVKWSLREYEKANRSYAETLDRIERTMEDRIVRK